MASARHPQRWRAPFHQRVRRTVMKSELVATFTMLLTTVIAALLMATIGPSAGCSSMPQVAPPVDPQRAIRVLDTALTAWQDGAAISDVR